MGESDGEKADGEANKMEGLVKVGIYTHGTQDAVDLSDTIVNWKDGWNWLPKDFNTKYSQSGGASKETACTIKHWRDFWKKYNEMGKKDETEQKDSKVTPLVKRSAESMTAKFSEMF